MRDWNSLAPFIENARKILKPPSFFQCPLPTLSNTEENTNMKSVLGLAPTKEDKEETLILKLGEQRD